MKALLQRSLFGLSALGLVLVGALPASAQAIRLGDDIEVDLTRPREREVQPRISSDGDRVNVEIYERPAPQTEIRVDQGQFEIRRTEQEPRLEIRRTEQEPRQRLDLSIPTN